MYWPLILLSIDAEERKKELGDTTKVDTSTTETKKTEEPKTESKAKPEDKEKKGEEKKTEVKKLKANTPSPASAKKWCENKTVLHADPTVSHVLC